MKKLIIQQKRYVVLACFGLLVAFGIKKWIEPTPAELIARVNDVCAPVKHDEFTYILQVEQELKDGDKNAWPFVHDRALGGSLNYEEHLNETRQYADASKRNREAAEGVLEQKARASYVQGDEAGRQAAEAAAMAQIEAWVKEYAGWREAHTGVVATATRAADLFTARLTAALQTVEKESEAKGAVNEKPKPLDAASPVNELYYWKANLRRKLKRVFDEKENRKDEWADWSERYEALKKHIKRHIANLKNKNEALNHFDNRLQEEKAQLAKLVGESSERPDMKQLAEMQKVTFLDDAAVRDRLRANAVVEVLPAPEPEPEPVFVVAATRYQAQSLVVHLVSDWMRKAGKQPEVRQTETHCDVYDGKTLHTRIAFADTDVSVTQSMAEAKAALAFRACRKEDGLADYGTDMEETALCVDAVIYYTRDASRREMDELALSSAVRYFMPEGHPARALASVCAVQPRLGDACGQTHDFKAASDEAGDKLLVGAYHQRAQMVAVGRSPIALKRKVGKQLDPNSPEFAAQLVRSDYPLNLLQDIRLVYKNGQEVPEAQQFCEYLTSTEATCSETILACGYAPALPGSSASAATMLTQDDLDIKKVLRTLQCLVGGGNPSNAPRAFGYESGSSYVYGAYMPYSMHFDIGKKEGDASDIIFSSRDQSFHLDNLGVDILRLLDEHGQIAIMVVGQASAIGDDENNQRLSEERAVTYVKNVLQSAGFLRGNERKSTFAPGSDIKVHPVVAKKGYWYANADKKLYLGTFGCGASRAEMDAAKVELLAAEETTRLGRPLTETEKDKIRANAYRRDQRAQIFVIVPNR